MLLVSPSNPHINLPCTDSTHRILLRLRQEGGPHTRLLLADYIVPPTCVNEDEDAELETPQKEKASGRSPRGRSSLVPAPEGSPLLSILGKADANAYKLDLTVSSLDHNLRDSNSPHSRTR